MSYPSSYIYETVYIVRPGVSDGDVQNIHQKIDAVIAKFQGTLKHREDAGIKEMAYEIKDERSGRYTTIVYNGKPGVVEEIERHFRISDDVIRFLTVAQTPEYDFAKVKQQIAMAEEEQKKNREFKEQKKRERMQ
ncbi:MAG: 30S ribosomal protein S6 [Proteobacteria bacterium]|jgi:small subunit ribosomal protein S6|nr:30S ribosomal protein S6 [Pseudomonadota bacterium]